MPSTLCWDVLKRMSDYILLFTGLEPVVRKPAPFEPFHSYYQKLEKLMYSWRSQSEHFLDPATPYQDGSLVSAVVPTVPYFDSRSGVTEEEFTLFYKSLKTFFNTHPALEIQRDPSQLKREGQWYTSTGDVYDSFGGPSLGQASTIGEAFNLLTPSFYGLEYSHKVTVTETTDVTYLYAVTFEVTLPAVTLSGTARLYHQSGFEEFSGMVYDSASNGFNPGTEYTLENPAICLFPNFSDI